MKLEGLNRNDFSHFLGVGRRAFRGQSISLSVTYRRYFYSHHARVGYWRGESYSLTKLRANILGDGRAGGKTVLIVEDNELNMKLFHDLLEAHGYRHGQHAQRALRRSTSRGPIAPI